MKKNILFISVFCFLLLLAAYDWDARASIGSCSVSVSPINLNANVSSTLVFSVKNQDPASEIKWVKFSAPTQDFEVLSGNSSGWPASVESPMEIVFRNGTLVSGASTNFNVNVQTGVNNVEPASWGVSVSDDAYGNGVTGCTGETGVAIVGSNTDKAVPVISNISVTDITQTSVTITWETNEDASSVVEYGKTNIYGNSKEDVGLKRNHSIILNDLTADTSYHFLVKSADLVNNVGISSDNTFMTLKTPESPVSTPEANEGGGGNSSRNDNEVVVKPTVKPKPKTSIVPTPFPTPEIVRDNLTPRVFFTTDFLRAYEEVPLVSGRVIDEGGVTNIQYSLDNGANWLGVQQERSANGTEFSFMPIIKMEGSYQIAVRAFDSSGNVGSARGKLVIDRYPPLVGPALVGYGPLVLVPDENQVFTVSAGVDIKVIFSASGGPETVELYTANGSDEKRQIFSLANNPETGLWAGMLSFAEPGEYELNIKAKDGAKKETERSGLYFRVIGKNAVFDAKGEKTGRGEATVFVRDRVSEKYVKWDSLPFGVSNPVQISDQGDFPLILPAGEYYVLLDFNGVKSRTDIFINDRTRVVSGGLKLSYKKTEISYFKKLISKIWPNKLSFVIAEQNFNREFGEKKIIGEKMPKLELLNETEELFGLENVKKPGAIIFITPWSPETPEQLKNITLSGESESIVGVLVQSSSIEANALKSRGGYDVATLIDRLGKSVAPFKLSVSPTAIFFDEEGTIVKVLSGVLSADNLQSEIGALKKLN